MKTIKNENEFKRQLAACETRDEIGEVLDKTDEEIVEAFVSAVAEFEKFIDVTARTRAVWHIAKARVEIAEMAGW